MFGTKEHNMILGGFIAGLTILGIYSTQPLPPNKTAPAPISLDQAVSQR
jgi:hypothetical protein